MGQRQFKITCLAITDKFGNMHRNQEISYDAKGRTVVTDTILTEDLLEDYQIDDYIEGGYIAEVEAESKTDDAQQPDRDDLVKEYMELSGKSKVSGTWGVKKLKEEIAKLKESD